MQQCRWISKPLYWTKGARFKEVYTTCYYLPDWQEQSIVRYSRLMVCWSGGWEEGLKLGHEGILGMMEIF